MRDISTIHPVEWTLIAGEILFALWIVAFLIREKIRDHGRRQRERQDD
jgi:hypothetical protein